ncbi:ankyrin repeat-containing protein, conserved, putative [Eimeria necatrix]|uniref:Ankyrin repeat-containing protein, conserved, putative n=1 Tax=Eimeria necatrix TaxID=51315 RepID=U6N3Q6_9EIME|nr:ankyrin repeat-containing protein, conserved, putative [Eimeria necatrix]CDJ69944.1 ankyrin repeat-containing protein, conserved, putative [Eimeria necatrix]
MFSWVSALRREQSAGLSSRLYTLSDMAEERLAQQKASGFTRDSNEVHKGLTAYEAALKIREQHGVKDEGQELEEKGKEQKQRGLREQQETSEILELQRMLPELLQRKRFKEAEGAICCFLDKNPRNADGFVLLAETYGHQRNQMGALSALWGAIHNCPGNRRLLRLLAQYEENFLMERCELPLLFKVKALQVPEMTGSLAHKGTAGKAVSPLFHPQGAPVMIVRQNGQTTAFANRQLSPGDLIFREKPFVCTPLLLETGQIFSTCFHCLQEREDPRKAYSCPVSPHTCPFVFCSWNCLMRNARLHAIECTCMPLMYAMAKESGFMVTFVLHLFRILIKASLQRETQVARSGKEAGAAADTDMATQLFALNSHEEAVRKGQPELVKKLQVLVRRLQQNVPPNLLLYLTEKELMHVALVVLQYSPFVSATSAAAAVERRNAECTLGRVFAPATALLHHSCVPTATVSLQEDGQLAVRAITFIPAGGYICVSAEADLFKSQKERKAVESFPRVFGCGCIRCKENDEGGRLLRGIRCFKCVRGFLCPSKGGNMLARLKAYEDIGASVGERVSAVKVKAEKKVATAGGGDSRERLLGKAKAKCTGGRRLPATSAASLEEQWLCNCCGLTDTKVSLTCASIERDLLQRQSEADTHLIKGSQQLATRIYGDLVDHYSSKLHPQHAVLFNVNTILAGLLATKGGKDVPLALILLRRAGMAAETVLPATSMTKAHLYLKLAELTYKAMQLEKQCRRGPSVPSEKIMEPLFCALSNCVACMGSDASLSVVMSLRLRRFAALLGVCTPPLLQVPIVRTEDVFVALYRAATNSRAASSEQIKEHFCRDPMSVAVALLRRGLHFPLALELFRAMKGTQHLPTGLSLLGLACLYSKDAIVGHLLKMGYDLFAKSPLGMTPLLAMCASRESGLPFQNWEISSDRSASKAAEETAAGTDVAQLAILRLMLQHCDSLDAANTGTGSLRGLGNKTLSKGKLGANGSPRKEDISVSRTPPLSSLWGLSRKRLLSASSHRFLGRSYPLHFAASNGKARLCRQLLVAGGAVEALNAESATALHLACVAGDPETVRVMLEHGANINAATLTGETPLVLAAYWLQDAVFSVLLEKGANCNIVTKDEGMTVLHAIAAGVLRQTRPLFRGLAWEGDLAAIALHGLSLESVARGTYTLSGSSLIPEEAPVDIRIPSSTLEGNDIFLFPGELMRRVQKAQGMLLLLLSHCDSCTYTRHTRKGFTAAELLLHCWENFQRRRRKLLEQGDLRFAHLTDEERRQVEERWRFVLHEINVLKDLLRLHHTVSVETANPGDLTPRDDQLREMKQRKLLSQAPWCFADEIAKAASGARSKAASVATGPDG